MFKCGDIVLFKLGIEEARVHQAAIFEREIIPMAHRVVGRAANDEGVVDPAIYILDGRSGMLLAEECDLVLSSTYPGGSATHE